MIDTSSNLMASFWVRRRLLVRRWVSAVLLSLGAALLCSGVLAPGSAQAVVSEYDPTDETHYCNFYDTALKKWVVGCFDATARISDLTSGAMPGDGKPVRPGDVLLFTYTLTNNTTTTIEDLSLYGVFPKIDCAPDPACLYGPEFDGGNGWQSNREVGLVPESLRIQGDPDVNMGHFDGGVVRPFTLLGQAGFLQPYASADFRGYLPPGATTVTTFQIQVPYNAPIGSTYAMTVNYTHAGDVNPFSFSGATARYAQVDALPTPEPTATATSTPPVTSAPTLTSTPTTTTTEPSVTASPTGTSTPRPTSTGSSSTTGGSGSSSGTDTSVSAGTGSPSTLVKPASVSSGSDAGVDSGAAPQALATTGTPSSTIWVIVAGIVSAGLGLAFMLASRNRRPRRH
ncbi:LPXTG-motif cell wall-anchored protein [Psychromicrobium silvestre]|uniref:LPXTG-motif cell wall-anchored protein n=1 Tax=Psychromicrobium silvestre TaxID=1645614 RepID=A0A7Y9S5T8_9MICC|nr:LPXTG-motif cell wall-anchored protein [Psychromicrobium silvestre]